MSNFKNTIGEIYSRVTGMSSQTSQVKNTFNVVCVPIPVAARCNLWVCGRLLAGIAGSNLVGT
jgi:hypothetical protein